MELFGTDGIRGKAYEYPITEKVAEKLGKATALILRKKKPVFIIGKDTRESSDMLEAALVKGIRSIGMNVLVAGVIPTPAVSYLVRKMEASGGIMISASHNPYFDNGIKFFNEKGNKLSERTEEEIEDFVLNNNFPDTGLDEPGKVEELFTGKEKYSAFAQSTVRGADLSGIKMVLDCAHGAAFEVAPQIFNELGVNVFLLNNSPDGRNINYESGALHPEKLREEIQKHSADIGIALDGDADRIILVDEKGTILDGDYILAIVALHFLKKGILKKSGLVVTDYSNLALDKLLKENNGKVIRVQNGDKYVSSEIRKFGYNLGGEHSGHIIFGDYGSTGDGIIAGLQILKIMKESGKKLSELASVFIKNPQIVLSVDVKQKKPLEEMRGLQMALRNIKEKLGSSARYIVRYSGTEMKARIMIEGEDRDMITEMASKLVTEIKKEVGIE